MTSPVPTFDPGDRRQFGVRLEHDPRFRQRIEKARESLRAGRGVRPEDLESE